MKRLNERDEMNIRNWLDEMGDRLYHDVILPEDAYRAHKTIKRLLFDIYMLQGDKKERDNGTKGNTGQSIATDFSDKSS